MFNTAKEKYAHKQGIKKGRKGGKVWHKKKPRIYRQKYSPYSSKPKTPKTEETKIKNSGYPERM